MSELYLVFDIETVALPWDSFSESQQEYIVRYATTEEEVQKKKDELALSPISSQIVCIGLQLMQSDEHGGYKLINKAAFADRKSVV